MKERKFRIYILCFGLLLINTLSLEASSDSSSHRKAPPLPPGQTARGFLTPSGWGSSQSMVYGYLAGTFPQVYSNKSDLLAGLGVALGDTCHALGFRAALNVNDVSEMDQYSANFILSHRFNKGSSISAGVLHLGANRALADAAPTYYVAFSHAVRWFRSALPGVAGLSYTLGIGNGRFYTMSARDRELGRWQHGTAIFGSVSAGITRNLVITAEWTGHNVCISSNWKPYIPMRLPFRMPSISIGLADPFRFTGAHPRLVASLAYGFPIPIPQRHCTP
ncbi:MAG: hypothetical protein KJS92_07920 [Bacteroidetes bacterium]|nr:hypothetical protein [Bacteroidota bacterium]